jgi:glycosyltransferase involved in cell wall biosynthesis
VLLVNVWSPLPPAPTGVADYVAEQLPALARHLRVEAICERKAPSVSAVAVRAPQEARQADLDVYHLGNSPAHGFAYRAALARPGVVVLHEWNLNDLVRHETAGRGDPAAYVRELRFDHGEAGGFLARQVLKGLGGEMLPSLFPVNGRVLDRSLAVVALGESVRARAARCLGTRPVLGLPLHLALAIDPPPSRAEARMALGLPLEAPILVAPGLATHAKRLDLAICAVARLRERYPGLLLLVVGAVDPTLPLAAWAAEAGVSDSLRVTGRVAEADFVRYLAAADLVLALRFPSRGETSAALVKALGVGRCALVTAGTPGAEEFPEGVVVPVDPGPSGEHQLVALLDRLLSDPQAMETLGARARDHVRTGHALESSVVRLAEFLAEVAARRQQLAQEIDRASWPEAGLLGHLCGELRLPASELGLLGQARGLSAIAAELLGESR